ncbi:hypothetical protein [Nitrobacter hamburgensis]|uniref:hypothetical protein n=1 Tax=Nitrobacter hamburgensis TaxID=912 RepID=UPI0012EE5BAB|nr:hypothetical protein [Nitrobacter hamburgensis]
MSVTGDDILMRYRALAESSRKAAEQARSDFDKQAWLEMARDWMKLAGSIERRAESS